MLLTRTQATELDCAEGAMLRELNCLLGRLCDHDVEAMRRTWDRVEHWMLQGMEAELAPLDGAAVRHLIQLHAVAMMQVELARTVEELQSPRMILPMPAAGGTPPYAA